MITLCPICCRPLKKGEAAVVRSEGGAYSFSVMTSDGDMLGEHKTCFDSKHKLRNLFDTYEP
jgi:RNase P subunit RPR2